MELSGLVKGRKERNRDLDGELILIPDTFLKEPGLFFSTTKESSKSMTYEQIAIKQILGV